MDSTTKMRIIIFEDPGMTEVDQGRYLQHFTPRDKWVAQFENGKKEIEPFIYRPDFEIIDEWHPKIMFDIFVSERITNMSNNIGDCVWQDLLPERYKLSVFPPKPARTLHEIAEYIHSFSNSSKLLKNIFAKELEQYLPFVSDEEHSKLILHEGSDETPINPSDIVRCMLSRGNISKYNTPLEKIVDLAFPELFFAIRQLGRFRFSISATGNHSTALATRVYCNLNAISLIRKSESRLTTRGEVVPSWWEYAALFAVFIVSNIMMIIGIWQNWAKRGNMLERVFDGTGLFAITAGIMLALISRRLDFYDLAGIVLRKKRFLQSYGELLSVLNLSDADIKSALSFQGVHIPPISSELTSYAFHKHNGALNPFSGLDTTAKDSNIIVGNKTALSRGSDKIMYYTVKQTGGMWYLVPSEDAMFRIVTDGDEKNVR